MNVLDVLQEKKIIDEKTAQSVATAVQNTGGTLEDTLIKQGIDPDTILEVLGEHYRLPTRRLSEQDKVPPNILAYIPEESARHYRFVPMGEKDGVLEVGITDPDNLTALDALNFISTKNNLPYKLFLILENDLQYVLKMYENLSGEVDEALSELESELSTEIAARTEEQEQEKRGQQEEFIKEDAPVTKIVATILRYAVDGGASDIHIEPIVDKLRVRFRVDGVLKTSLELPLKVHQAVVARTKILSSMRLDEKRKPQDGRFSATIDDRKIDFRVSTFPTHYGEKVVMRILDPESGVRSIETVGISEHNLKAIREAIKAPYGIILISGPTGSGKSTTLYAMLKEVDRLGKNVLSLEDPVEYNIEGVNQSQVRPDIGYTFASGLRSVLRQDPDIIMVGEIRDKETAQLAIQAALTGHLVFSTIHTNNAVGVIPRLIDMGVDPYLIAPTLVLAMAQRLVRTICPGTGKPAPLTGSLKMMVNQEFENLPEKYRGVIPESESVLHAESTEECPNGTKGRTAVMEAIRITSDLEQLILEGASEDAIYTVARKNGFITMKQDAIMKAMRHEIPFEEISTLGSALTGGDLEMVEEAEMEEVDDVDKTGTPPEENTV